RGITSEKFRWRVYGAGVPVSEAVGMALVVVGGTSLAGSLMQFRGGNLDLRAALLFAATGMAGAYGGARFTHLVSQPLLLTLFSAIMFGVSVTLLRDRREAPGPSGRRRVLGCAVAGATVGALTGFLGIGGGFLIVPALVWFAGLDIRKATGTSLPVIALNSLAGLAGQIGQVHFDWGMAWGFLCAATVGMAVGIVAKGRLSERAIRKTFALFVFASGVAMAWQNAAKLLTSR
ncbi:MAG: sulfite exporter TauE/SafE family protein, partial [Verrucomicrobiae bacterium]